MSMRALGLAVVGALILAAAPAVHADPPPVGPVPSSDQVAAVMHQLSDPHAPDEVKSGLVDGGLSPAELGELGGLVNDLAFRAELPLNFAVTDIVAAPGDVAGMTVSATTWLMTRAVVEPMVLIHDDGTWRLTHDSFTPTFLGVLRSVIFRIQLTHYW
ncbi:hypothetical protein [Mycolicibacillus trivialis]|uniref:Low molecular weight antigen MTB12-like C-terminal domain-containing protein n=1 Tax=Mycolicibacillus trivialis TaxID=1798 RepID=A0A1X2ERP3_9MYCO|nr:hypothetical protein [Mycolicibacillus trivialis]ORX08458.1 hypothetical protein AWC30_02160 [Mycolicibacillus trivialis]